MALEMPRQPDVLLLLELTEDASLQGMETYLSRTLDLCAEWFRASGATLFLREGDDEDYHLAARAGTDTRVPKDAVIRHGEGIAGTAIAHGEPLLLHDRIDRLLLGGQQFSEPNIGTSIVVPLRARQTGNLGVLCLSRRKGEEEFTDKDLSVARTLASQIALAVANARLFTQTLAVEKKLSEASRLAEIGQMTAAIAHEIRNPLTGIRAAAQMIESSGGESAEFGTIIVEETDKLDRLCAEFLDFAKPLQMRMAPVALDELVRHVVELESSEFQREGVSLSLEIAPDLPIFTLDSMRIEQVCHNVLRNARQACSQGGRVEVQVGPNGISVEDDGKGMSEETLARLFTPFFTTKPQGTGLGLCVASKIVDAHGGHIVVESAEGKGTRFRIELEPGHKEE